MKMRKILFYSISVLVIVLFSQNIVFGNEDRDFGRLLRSIENNDLKKFQKMLESGADPSYIGEHKDPSYWINCLAALSDTSEFLELIARYGGDIFYIREDYAKSSYYAPAASALNCSVMNWSLTPFVYLIEEGADIFVNECHLCENERIQYNLLESIVTTNRYTKALWLFQHRRDDAKKMITKRVLFSMNHEHEGLVKNLRPAFWQLVDIFEKLGYQIEPKLTREKFND